MKNEFQSIEEVVAKSYSARIEKLLVERGNQLPVWVKAPGSGLEHYTALSRSKLYELDKLGHIRSVSIRQPGQTKGARLFELASILSYLDKAADEFNSKRTGTEDEDETN